jgi:hypothetical protein
MAVLRILVTVSDTQHVVESAASMAFAPATVPDSPPGFVIDPSFAAVPIAKTAMTQTLTLMTARAAASPTTFNQFGHGSYVVRGLIDENDLARATQATLLPDGTPRIFVDAEVSGFPTCGGDPPLATRSTSGGCWEQAA